MYSALPKVIMQSHVKSPVLFTYILYNHHFRFEFLINMVLKTTRTELEQCVKDRIIGMNTSGMSGRSIAQELNLCPSTVIKVIKRFKKLGSTENATWSGWSKKLNEHDHRHLGNNVKKGHHSTLQEITNSMPLKVSSSTIRHALHEHSIHNRITIKKPFISDINERKQLRFAHNHQKLTINDWKHILWTDESSFEIGKNSRQIRVWHPSSKCYDPSCLMPSFKSRRQTVMIEVFNVREGVEVVIQIMYLITNHGGLYTWDSTCEI